jgi:5,10-methylenetetrahydromethanopterin reductase
VSPRELGLGLQTDKRPGAYAALARTAEESGFDVVTTFNDLWYQPALPALLEIAAATSRVRVGPACLNPYTVHPVEIAGQIAALDTASHGRAFLGLAAGAWLGDLGVEQRRPAATVREAWIVISKLLAGDTDGFEGEVFRLASGTRLAYPVERPAVPLLIGTWSPRLTELAGAEAHELKLGGTANPDLVRLVRERLDRAEDAAGRERGSVSLVAGAVTVVGDDSHEARAHARARVAMYIDVVAPLDPTLELEPELIERIHTLLAEGDAKAAGRQIGDELLDRFAFSGTADEIAAQAAAIFDAGGTRVEFGGPHGLDEHDGVRLLGSRVIPQLRA